MKETTGDIWKMQAPETIVLITTNGYIKKNGEAVMGKGIAKQAALNFPDLPKTIGIYLKKFGNRCFKLPHHLATFPVKPVAIAFNKQSDNDKIVNHMRGKFQIGDLVPGWAAMADPQLIVKSANQIIDMADNFGWVTILLPRPGCGNGGLKWEKIKPLIQDILDDRFISCSYR